MKRVSPLTVRTLGFVQVRVLVEEARQLQSGGVLSALCRVTLRNQSNQTRTQISGGSAFWQELFFFHFNISSVELTDESIEFAVRATLLPNGLILWSGPARP